jgi:hypothetical protein
MLTTPAARSGNHWPYHGDERRIMREGETPTIAKFAGDGCTDAEERVCGCHLPDPDFT